MLEQLRDNHREIARLKFEGYKPAEIAQQVGMAVGSVRQILADPLCQSMIKRFQDEADSQVIDVRKRLADMSVHALDVIENILRDGSAPASTQLKAAEGVLDRNGYSPIQKSENITAHLSKEDLEDIKRRAYGERVINNG